MLYKYYIVLDYGHALLNQPEHIGGLPVYNIVPSTLGATKVMKDIVSPGPLKKQIYLHQII